MSNSIQLDFGTSPTRVWELDVPVVVDKDNNNIKAYLTDSIGDPPMYNELCYYLSTAEDDATVDLYINTPGGVVDSALMLSNAIENSKAFVTAHLSGTVASAGTIIALSCDELIINSHLSFMIHNYSGGMHGKGHEMKARQKFLDDHLNTVFRYFYKDFLTEEEMERVIEGTDMWMNEEEVYTRWNSGIA